jgi:hypothetical protein
MAEVNPHHQCRPAYMSLSVGAIPAHKGLLAKAALPFGLAVHPLSEGEGSLGPGGIPVVNFGAAGVIRCKRCRAYINPFSSFVDGGRRWRCNLCSYVNDVPQAYYAPCDAAGQRVDRDSRPELTCGSVEFVATAEYMMRPPQPPVYMFVVDVSYGAVASGVLQTAVDTIRGVSRGERVLTDGGALGWLGGWLAGWAVGLLAGLWERGLIVAAAGCAGDTLWALSARCAAAATAGAVLCGRWTAEATRV